MNEIFFRAQAHAVAALPFSERQTTNLHIDKRVIPAGETVGPKHLRIVTKQASVLVFADTKPMANFGHDCRYLFYSADSGALAQTVAAQLPPFGRLRSDTCVGFHRPVQPLPSPVTIPIRPILGCPTLFERTRYAILWSGASEKRHLNDLEFLYRTLIDRYGCDPGNIYALSFDGTLNTYDGVQSTWPGDNTPYRIQITGTGDRTGFEAAVDELKGRIDWDDLLLIHTNNHGDVEGDPGEACWLTWPDEAPYFASDFAGKIGELPRFSKLVCMFEPCHGGGFNAPVIAQSTADSTSVASAAIVSRESIGSSDLNWDCFARDWISAQAGHDPYGAALAFNPDGDHDGIVEAEEAFGYANAVKDPNDTPNFNESSETGGDISLGRQYVLWGWWCAILRRELEQYYVKLPIPEYYERLRTAQPDLVNLSNEIDTRSAALRREYEPRLKAVIEDAFEGR